MTLNPDPPRAQLQMLPPPDGQAPRSLMGRGLLYWLASLVAASNAFVSMCLPLYAVVGKTGQAVTQLQVLACKLPLCVAAVTLLFFHAPAALTLLAPTLALIQVGDLFLGVQQRSSLQIGVALFFSVSTLALSIPLLAEQALKRKRWLHIIQMRSQIPQDRK